ncbi:hypothetical protein IKE_05896 [Bacillus cereus VD196]|uniref:Uncharacterized protein n=1 Tax=Bacillus cereus VD196 TaxID=1053243 RepID=A0A9W5V5X3_BACCE|nr:hypothetical protein [Bacillus cereus]EJR93300.1 hypothetical protein IKG_05544 [Bacillus cereus VD200]EOO61578.1 hypothetical protein IKE_05896 [Bacillus cereus VD196]
MDKSLSGNSTQLLQEIDQKMSIIVSVLQQMTREWITEDVYKIHHMLLELFQSLLTLQQ